MRNFARLGISVGYRDVADARKELGNFTRAGRTASDAAKGLERSTNRANAEMRRIPNVTSKAISSASALGKALAKVAVGMASVASAQQSVAMARGFQSALAETSTLIRGTRAEMSLVEQEARRMAGTFGGTATDQVRAFYQAISAGADGVEAATKLLDQANRLAIGGVTDITTGVDALTTAVNAYSATGLTAAAASDAMFVGMKAGKTTIGELAAQMGQIVPVASAAGVSFDEMIAGISALTTQGQSTATATTGLRAAITGILQPSKQAADAAKALGLEFSASALQSKGLEQFLTDIVDATGGSTDAMTQLFGSVEALNAVLAFSGGADQTFTDIMEAMGKKAGATDTAYKKLADGLDQRLNSVLGRLANHALTFGNTLLTVAVPAMEAFANGIDFMAQNSDALVTVLSGLVASMIPSMIAGLGGLATVLGTTAGAATGLATALWAATGPWGVLAGLVGAAAAAYLTFGKETKTFQDTMSELEAAQETLNTQVVAFGSVYAPKAGAEAINAANDYLKLAKAAREAAAAQLASDSAEVARIQKMVDNGHLRNLTVEEEAKLDARLHGAKSRLTVVEQAYQKALDARDETAKTVMRSGSAMTEAMEQLNSEITVSVKGLGDLSKASGKAGGSLDKVKSEAEAFSDALEEAAYNTQDLGEAKAQVLIGGIDGISNAWGDFASRGLRDFKGFAKNVLKSFTSMLAQMAALSARNRIMISLGVGGVSAGQAVAGTTGGGAGGGLLGSLFGGGGGFVGSLGTNVLTGGTFAAGSGLLGGLGATANAVFGTGGGIGGLFSIGANAAAAGGGLAASIGAAIPVLGAAALAFSLFRSKTKHLDNGLRVTADNVGILVEQFDKIQKSRFGGLSKSTSFNVRVADEATAAPIEKAIGSITSNILAAGEQLGLSADNFSSWSTQIQVSLKGLDEAAQQRELQRIFDTVSEQFSYAALGSFNDALGGTLIREGETAADTLNALVASLQAANNGLDLVNGAMFDASVAGANMARSLTDAFGGVQNFNTAMDGYFTAFYSQEEQLEARTQRLADQFEALNVVIPNTKAGLRGLIEAQDTSTQEGRELYAGLVLLSGEFANLSQLSEQLYGSASLAASGISKLVQSAASNALAVEDGLAQAQAAALTEYRNVLRIMDVQIRSAQTARDSIKSIFDILTDGLDARGPLDTVAQKLRRDSLQAELAAGISDPQRLRKVIQGLNEPSQQYFSSYSDYALDYYRTSALLDDQKDIAEDQLSEAEKQLLALRDQKSSIEKLYGPLLGINGNTDDLDGALARLETAMRAVEAATLRVENALLVLSNSLLQAIAGIRGTGAIQGYGRDAFALFNEDRTNGIFSDAAAGALTDVAGQVNSLYQDVFGRNADALGLKFYGDLLQSGQVKAGRVTYDLMTSQEAKTGVTPGFGSIGSAAQPVDPVEALYGSMLGRAADPAGVAFWKSTGLQGEALINAFRDGALAAGDVPAFASGGDHIGGIRMVGERGPELELTGPSRIFSASQTKQILSGGGARMDLGPLLSELRALRREVAELKADAKRRTEYNKRASDVLEEINYTGVDVRAEG